MKRAFLSLFLFSNALLSLSYLIDENKDLRYGKRTENGLHIPLHQTSRRALNKRQESGSGKLGDYYDLVYTVLLSIGTVITPVILSTRTSDLWIYSDACTNCNASGVPLYPQATFEPDDLDATIVFGGEQIPETKVSGLIGQDTIGLAHVHISNQYFMSVNTSTTSMGLRAAGVLGLGLPLTSTIWNALVARKKEELKKTGGLNSEGQVIIESYPTMAPLISRMAANRILKEPSFTVTLQRTTVELTGRTPGLLSVGELPEGVRNESLSWVPVRRYPVTEGGLPSPIGPPQQGQIYAEYWEVPVDDVFFDGKRLSPSKLAPTDLKTSALVDMGTAFIHGPSDVISEIRSQMGGSSFPCGEPHTLAFKIGGVVFPVDPRDLIYSPDHKSVAVCNAFLADQTIPDTTVPGARFSWVLGTAFLKGVVASFYHGDVGLFYFDPPRMGFLSRVPINAGDLLKKAVENGSFPYLTDELAGSGPVGPNQNTLTTDASSASAPTASVSSAQQVVIGESTFGNSFRMFCALVVLMTFIR